MYGGSNHLPADHTSQCGGFPRLCLERALVDPYDADDRDSRTDRQYRARQVHLVIGARGAGTVEPDALGLG